MYDWIEYSVSEDSVYWFCTTFVQLILRKIIKIVATRCQILRPKCTKFDFDWGSAPHTPRWGSLQRSPDPLAGFRGPTSKGEGKGGRGRKGKGGRERKGREVRERGRDVTGGVDPQGFAEMTPLNMTDGQADRQNSYINIAHQHGHVDAR